MSKKFTFKHPAGTSPATAQAVPLSSSSSTASMMSVASVPSVVNMQDDDDLWLDDIDEDMLVQASQMVEAQAANATHDDRMEIDAETLNKVMKEESTSDDVWNEAASNPFQKQKYAPQTQTVFQTRPEVSAPVFAAPIRENKAGPSSKVHDKKVNEELDKLRYENKSLLQKHQAKAGEISFLRNELTRKNATIENARKEQERLLKLKEEEIKKIEADNKAQAERAKTDKEFLQRELDQANDALQMFKKNELNVTITNDNSSRRKIPATPDHFQPPSKRAKTSKTQRLPSNIDESFFSKGDQQQESIFRTAETKAATCQTLLRRQRRNVIVQNLNENTLPYVALASSGDSKLMKNGIGALHSSLQIQLERLALIVDDIVSQLKQDSGQVEANLQSAIILVDHISSHPEASDKLSSQLSAIIQALFDALVQSSTLKKPLVLRLLSSVLHQESLVDLIDEEKLLNNVLKVLDSSSTISTNVDDSSVLTQTVVDVVDLVTSMEPISVMSKILCSHRNKTGLLNSLWAFMDNCDLSKIESRVVKSMSFQGIFLTWHASFVWKKCGQCRSALLKLLVTISWVVVNHLEEQARVLEYYEMGKACLQALHFLWESDPEDFVKVLVGHPLVQRRYIWSINHLSRLAKSKKLIVEDFLIDDLSVECM